MENKVPIHKIIRNIATDGKEHAEEIREWLINSKENKDTYLDLQNLWRVSGKFPDRYSPDRNKAWDKVRSQVRNKKSKQSVIKRISGIAAAAVIIFFSIWLGSELNSFDKTTYSEIISPAGQKTRVVLPDSSEVLLNGDSKLRYSNNFAESDRKIELVGEAYFDVRKNPSMQFVVNTSELDIKVYGTSFNVRAYANDQLVEVGLKSGKVGIGRNDKEIARLIPGEMASFDKTNKKLNIAKANADIFSAWTKNELVFEEKTMEEIMKYVERWYGVDIDVSSELLDNEQFTFKVKTESLQELLALIKILKPINYQIDGEHVQIIKP